MALAITVPAPVGAKVTTQLEVVALRLASVHGLPVKLPAAVPPFVKATDPRGAEAVPAEVSFTKPVQLMDWETTAEDGVHVAAVVVGRLLTVTVLLVLGPLLLHLVVSLVV